MQAGAYEVLAEGERIEPGDVSVCLHCRFPITWFPRVRRWEVDREDKAYCPLNNDARTHRPGTILREKST